MSNLQAAVGVAQIDRWESSRKKKRWIGKTYTAGLENLDTIQLPLSRTVNCENIYWVFGLVIKESEISRDHVTETLREAGIETRPFFHPLHKQPILKELEFAQSAQCPISEWLGERGFYLPSGLALSSEEIETVIQVTRKIFS